MRHLHVKFSEHVDISPLSKKIVTILQPLGSCEDFNIVKRENETCLLEEVSGTGFETFDGGMWYQKFFHNWLKTMSFKENCSLNGLRKIHVIYIFVQRYQRNALMV